MFEQNNEAMRKKDKKQYNYIVNAAGSVFEKMDELEFTPYDTTPKNYSNNNVALLKLLGLL